MTGFFSGASSSASLMIRGRSSKASGRKPAPFGQGVPELDSPERPLQGDDLIPVRELVLAQEIAAEAAEDLLGHFHHVVVISVRFVKLEHREFRVMLGVDPFVPEIAVDLIDLFQAADDQALEVELRGDPEKEVHVQGVMMGDERPGHCPPGDGLHHRGFDLHVAAAVKIPPKPGNDRAPEAEHLADLGIHHQVQIAAPVAKLNVLEAVPLLRQRMEALGQEDERFAKHGQLARPGFKERALDRQPIADIQQLPPFVGFVADLVFPDIGLDSRFPIGDVEEGGLAHQPDGHHPPGDNRPDGSRFELLGGRAGICGHQLARGMRQLDFVGKRVDPGLDQAAVLVRPDQLLLTSLSFGLRFRGGGGTVRILVFGHDPCSRMWIWLSLPRTSSRGRHRGRR